MMNPETGMAVTPGYTLVKSYGPPGTLPFLKEVPSWQAPTHSAAQVKLLQTPFTPPKPQAPTPPPKPKEEETTDMAFWNKKSHERKDAINTQVKDHLKNTLGFSHQEARAHVEAVNAERRAADVKKASVAIGAIATVLAPGVMSAVPKTTGPSANMNKSSVPSSSGPVSVAQATFPTSSMPAWLIPAAIVGALLMFGKKLLR